MKDKIKKIVTPIFLSVLCGTICGRVIFSIYEDTAGNVLNSNVIYLLQDNEYDDYNSMKTNTISSNYIYYEENGKYKRVVAMTKNKDNINKIKGIYDNKLTVSEYLLNDKDINEKLEEYDNKLKNINNKDEIKEIILEMINIYKGLDDVKMVKIS